MSWKSWQRVRQAAQILFFMFYITLIFAVVQKRVAPALSDIFFRLDPLSALGAMLASRQWISKLGLALVTIGLTVIIGRVWCGWICPLGSLLEWVSFRKARKRAASISPRWRLVKYFLLATSLAAALFGGLTLLVLDPIAIFTRTLTTAILPAIFYTVNSIETALYHVSFLTPALDGFEGLVRGTILPVEQPAFAQSIAIAALFFGLFALNMLAHRFWCRYLCPLGALLGILSKVTLFRPVIGSACIECTRCAVVCKPGAVDTTPTNFHIMPSECTVCLDCMANCKPADIQFKFALKPAPRQEFDLSRRTALGALATGAAGVLLLGTDLRLRQDNQWRIRPPGVTDENTFLSTCLRCSQCMKICPTTALQPALMEAGLEGLWTPLVVPRVGYCDYGCTACGQVCPSGAIPLLGLEEKRQAVIGKASIDRDRCLPWASGVPCIVCEEMCPTPQKSIRLEEAQVVDSNGLTSTVQRPSVLRDVCIGCGICEHNCPLEGNAAIRVYNA
ncbi:MAG: 4Fe-4S binding protein [Anaerolineales bacterium]|jgi:polyferredoxin/formate hydrogenlyase subunit 6/NADH:ubiquinone oxidoreductase subunit I